MDWTDDPVLGDNGYPSDAELERVRTWPVRNGQDAEELLAYVRTRWSAESGYWHRNRCRTRDKNGALCRIYRAGEGVSRGNQSLVWAMLRNVAFWSMCSTGEWIGGHYEFRVPSRGEKG